MLTTKKVLEDAIEERQKDISSLKRTDCELSYHCPFIQSDIENFESQIAELKQSLQIIYDNQKK